MTADWDEYSSDEDAGEFNRRALQARRTKATMYEPTMDDSEIARVRKLASVATTNVQSDCDAIRARGKERDEATLRQIDEALKQTSLPPSYSRRGTGVSTRLRRMNPDYSSSNDIQEAHINGSEQPVRKSYHWSAPRRPYTVKQTDEDRFNYLERNSGQTARHRMKQVEARLDGILDYEVPSADNFRNMRHHLRGISDKMVIHRQLLDRYSGLELDKDNDTVTNRIEDKYRQLEERMPCLSGVQRTYSSSKEDHLSSFDPNLIPGYATGLSVGMSDRNAELHGRIRSLLCKTRQSSRSSDAVGAVHK